MLLRDIRETFVNFFKTNDHQIVKSSSLIPDNDPTLMFTNSGMVQFKNFFTGVEKPKIKAAVSSQKCVRAGGKHNDLDNVGYTARHHTFFEMLGNFSFGDYFKERAIRLAWELLTNEFKLPKDKLLVTVFHEDTEAIKLWKKCANLPDDRIIQIATSDNFWSMGPVGPCGPCSEIFYDHGPSVAGGPPGSPEEDGDRFVEIWNLVFMQYEQMPDGNRIDLPKPSIDTGMGLERIAAVLQGKHDNYDTDLFRKLIENSASFSNTNPYGSNNIHHRVISDHLRSASFLIADGVMPSNEGRGYVLRRIMRRAMRHCQLLGCNEPHLHKIFPTLLEQMGSAFPELIERKDTIENSLKEEETRFKLTLDRGLKLLGDELATQKDSKLFSGEVAFKLYDTYGFPLDLTEDVLRENDKKVDIKAFEVKMKEQRQKARASWTGSGDKAEEKIWAELRSNEDATEFLGYENDKSQGLISKIIKDGKYEKKISANASGMIVMNQTCFYGESGGQVGDQGWLRGVNGEGQVIDTKRVGQIFVHFVEVKKGYFEVGDNLEQHIDKDLRLEIKSNHSATHLVHEALRRVAGDHVAQRGSLNNGDRLRFDFSHDKPLTEEQIFLTEQIVNERIRKNTKVITEVMQLESAKKQGARALFGEKYSDDVRVVKMSPENGGYFSIELCGGTHVNSTGDIGFLKIVSESASSSGVRRLEAVTGKKAVRFVENIQVMNNRVSSLLNVNSENLIERVNSLLEEKKRLEQKNIELNRALISGENEKDSQKLEKIGADIGFIGQIVKDVPSKELRTLVDNIKKKNKFVIVALFSKIENKVQIAVGISDSLIEKVSAVDLVKILSSKTGGTGGGGRPDFAQGGGTAPDQAENALVDLKFYLKNMLSDS